ncbi:MAG: hypothetical protein HQL46_07185 [Gammaproteobacteria bacterium]|nr:hypothetical protein [Gammaproteobacteria bacterium]
MNKVFEDYVASVIRKQLNNDCSLKRQASSTAYYPLIQTGHLSLSHAYLMHENSKSNKTYFV